MTIDKKRLEFPEVELDRLKINMHVRKTTVQSEKHVLHLLLKHISFVEFGAALYFFLLIFHHRILFLRSEGTGLYRLLFFRCFWFGLSLLLVLSAARHLETAAEGRSV